MTLCSLRKVIPILDVRNVDEALRYYVERLGFQLEFRYAADPENYAGVFRDNVYLHMQWQHQEHFAQGTAGRLRIRIAVDDPDALLQEFQQTGAVDVTAAVRTTEWGTREFGFRDPDGNGLTFFRNL